MRKPEIHSVEPYVNDNWVEEFAADGVAALERLLAKHARFGAYLEEQGL